MESLLIEFLSDPESYPYEPSGVKIVQTHISIVAIAPPFVFKFKKNINFGFIDYSTRQKRKENIIKELSLNKRLCDKMYLEMIPVYSDSGRLSFTVGEIFEYGLKMKYMPDENNLLKIIQNGEEPRSYIKAVARRLKNFYKKLEPAPAGYGSMEKISEAINGNFTSIEPNLYLLPDFCRLPVTVIKKFGGFALDALGEYIQKRVSDGWVRDCHGDLRLEHIYVFGNEVCIYDCIEFNDNFRFIDIANDLAFLAMDMDYHNKNAEAEALLSGVLSHKKEPLLHELVSLYKCYRAMVRVKVNLLLANETEVGKTQKEAAIQQAAAYLGLGLKYAVCPRPTVFWIMGKVGSGKSTAAEFLSQALNIRHLNSDVIRKNLAGYNPFEVSDDTAKKRIYTAEFSEMTYGRLMDEMSKEIQLSRSAVIDATFSSENMRAEFRKKLFTLHANFFVIETIAPENVVEARLIAREKKKTRTSDATIKEKHFLDNSYNPPDELKGESFIRLDTSDSKWRETLMHAILDKNLSDIHLAVKKS